MQFHDIQMHSDASFLGESLKYINVDRYLAI